MNYNNDWFVLRNGRTVTNVTVFNYPEHLDPFGEDKDQENLKIWKYQTEKSGNVKRRNSFSIDVLKEMWTSKTLNLKRQSSSIGKIRYKSSENPLELQRSLKQDSCKTFGFLNPKQPYIEDSSLKKIQRSRSINKNSLEFVRHGSYRNSLQAINSTASKIFPTFSKPMRRYEYRGSLTPQPVRNEKLSNCVDSNRRLSQSSVAGTNPFDTDDDFELNSLPLKREPRKKRRAPLPPTQVQCPSLKENFISNLSCDHESSRKPSKKENNQSGLELDTKLKMKNGMKFQELTNIQVMTKKRDSHVQDQVENVEACAFENSSLTLDTIDVNDLKLSNDNTEWVGSTPSSSVLVQTQTSSPSNSLEVLKITEENESEKNGCIQEFNRVLKKESQVFSFVNNKNVNLSTPEKKELLLSKNIQFDDKISNLERFTERNISSRCWSFKSLNIDQTESTCGEMETESNKLDNKIVISDVKDILAKEQNFSTDEINNNIVPLIKTENIISIPKAPNKTEKCVGDIIKSINRSQRLLNASVRKTKENPCSFIDNDHIGNDSSQNENSEHTIRTLNETREKVRQIFNNISSIKTFNESKEINIKNEHKTKNIKDKGSSNESRDKFYLIKSDQDDTLRSSKLSTQTKNLDWNPVPKPKRTKEHFFKKDIKSS